MTDIETLKAAIAETNSTLSQKVKLLETNVKETANSIKDTVEQGAANVRSVTNAISPVHQLREHPYLVTGVLLGLGVYLGSRSGRNVQRKNRVKSSQAANENTKNDEIPLPSKEEDSSPEVATPSKIRAIAEPVVIGIFAAAAGEMVKKYFPKIEAQATAVQSALIAEMTGRIVEEFK